MAVKLGIDDVSFRLGAGEVAAVYLGSQEVWSAVVPATLYFDGAVDDAWTTVGNWWLDAGHTQAAGRLPTSDESVVATASITASGQTVVDFTLSGEDSAFGGTLTVTGNATFNSSSANNGTVTGNATFNSSSGNLGTVTGNATFNGSSANNGTVTGDATFNDNSANNGTVTGDATFNDNSYNDGTVTGNATFNDSSVNFGTVSGTATFTGNACNSGGTAGTFVPDPPPACPE
jgi:hypothetical protein